MLKIQHAILPVLRPQSPAICSSQPPNSPSHALMTLDFQWTLSNFVSKIPRTESDGCILTNLLGWGVGERGGIEGAKISGREDDKVEAGFRFIFSLEKGRGCDRVGVVAVFWKLRTSHLQFSPQHPSRKPGVRLRRDVRPAGMLLCPTLSPPNPPVTPTRADHERSQNNPKMILETFLNIILVSFWYHFGIIWVSLASPFFVHLRTLQLTPLPSFFWAEPQPTLPLPSQHPSPCLPPSTCNRVK